MKHLRLCRDCKHYGLAEIEEPCASCLGVGSVINGTDRPKWESDGVNHPIHYNQGKYECIDVMLETFGKEATQHFCLLNAFKYIWRTGEKNGVEDVRKARWYLDKYLELEGETNE